MTETYCARLYVLVYFSVVPLDIEYAIARDLISLALAYIHKYLDICVFSWHI